MASLIERLEMLRRESGIGRLQHTPGFFKHYVGPEPCDGDGNPLGDDTFAGFSLQEMHPDDGRDVPAEAQAQFVVAAVNALPDLLKLARAVLDEHELDRRSGDPCPGCPACAALEPLFREEGE